MRAGPPGYEVLRRVVAGRVRERSPRCFRLRQRRGPASSCSGVHHATLRARQATMGTSSATGSLPGTGKPPITIGDKNYTEQFILGELYKQALRAQGYEVSLNRNIGPTEVTIPALESGRIDIYPEYLSTWIRTVAGLQRRFRTEPGAFEAGQLYASSQGLKLLRPTPFSDTTAIAVTVPYARANRLRRSTTCVWSGDARRSAARHSSSRIRAGFRRCNSPTASLRSRSSRWKSAPDTRRSIRARSRRLTSTPPMGNSLPGATGCSSTRGGCSAGATSSPWSASRHARRRGAGVRHDDRACRRAPDDARDPAAERRRRPPGADARGGSRRVPAGPWPARTAAALISCRLTRSRRRPGRNRRVR